MKKKSFNKKLSLNKMTISNLSNKEKSYIYGGVNTTSPTDGASCINACFPKPGWSDGLCTSVFCPSLFC